MRITERQLRRIVREVIVEEQINEGLKDSTIIKTAVAVLAAVGMYASITNGSPKDKVIAAQEVVKSPEGQDAVIDVINNEALNTLKTWEDITILNQ